jgi:hypothetical protein
MRTPSIFDPAEHRRSLDRLAALTPDTPRLWGTMTPAQIVAHLCVSYEYAFGERTDRPPLVMRLLLRVFFRSMLVGDRPYPRNSRTAPTMVMRDDRDLDHERARLVSFMERIHREGAAAWDGREQITLGRLTAEEWSTLFHKHLDHHLRQFGV